MKMSKQTRIIKHIMFAAMLTITLILIGCVEHETIIVKNNTAKTVETPGQNSSQENNTIRSNTSAPQINLTPTTSSCKFDSECGASGEIDSARCWQRTVYTRFNDSKCIKGRCTITSYESITEICKEDTQLCQSGKCVQKPWCYGSYVKDVYHYGQIKDENDTIYKDYCIDNSTLIDYSCDKEYPEKIQISRYTCDSGCEKGRCNPETN